MSARAQDRLTRAGAHAKTSFMSRIDRYILSHMAGPFFGALFGVLALLMLERLLRLLDLVNSNEGALRYIFDMLTNLAPHYLGLALPAALFIACYVGYRRLATTSEIAALQSIGRGLRLKDNNSAATLYDIADDLTYNEKENYTLAHFRERINIYSEEEFNYEIHNIELNNGRSDSTNN